MFPSQCKGRQWAQEDWNQNRTMICSNLNLNLTIPTPVLNSASGSARERLRDYHSKRNIPQHIFRYTVIIGK